MAKAETDESYAGRPARNLAAKGKENKQCTPDR